MPTWIIALLPLIERAIADAPAFANRLKELLSKENVTPEDWEALKSHIEQTPYEVLVPHSGLKPTPPE